MSFLTPTAAGERDVLAAFAVQQVNQIRTTLHGLTTEQVHQRTTASDFTLAMLARHIHNVAVGWGEAVAIAPECPTSGAEEVSGDDDAFHLTGTETLDELRADLDRTAAALADAIARADLDAIVPAPEAPWFEGVEGWQARWVAVHIIAEIARHAGHADIIRQSLDGKVSYELNARADGELADDEEWGGLVLSQRPISSSARGTSPGSSRERNP